MKYLERGSGFLLLTALLEGLSPVFLHRASEIFPPVVFLLCVNAVAAILLTIILILRRAFPIRITRSVFFAMLGVAVFIYGGYILVLLGTRNSSGVSTTILLQSEMVWVFLFSWIILRERITPRSVLGAVAAVLGTLAVLWKGTFAFQGTEWLIVAGTALFPAGNACAKKALRSLPPVSVLFLRYLFGITLLLPVSLLLREDWGSVPWDTEHLLILLPYAVLVFTISKICWYEGLSRHALHIATSAIVAVPAFSLVFAYFVLGEIPTLLQWLGFVCTLAGMGLLFGRQSEEAVLP